MQAFLAGVDYKLIDGLVGVIQELISPYVAEEININIEELKKILEQPAKDYRLNNILIQAGEPIKKLLQKTNYVWLRSSSNIASAIQNYMIINGLTIPTHNFKPSVLHTIENPYGTWYDWDQHNKMFFFATKETGYDQYYLSNEQFQTKLIYKIKNDIEIKDIDYGFEQNDAYKLLQAYLNYAEIFYKSRSIEEYSKWYDDFISKFDTKTLVPSYYQKYMVKELKELHPELIDTTKTKWEDFLRIEYYKEHIDTELNKIFNIIFRYTINSENFNSKKKYDFVDNDYILNLDKLSDYAVQILQDSIQQSRVQGFNIDQIFKSFLISKQSNKQYNQINDYIIDLISTNKSYMGDISGGMDDDFGYPLLRQILSNFYNDLKNHMENYYYKKKGLMVDEGIQSSIELKIKKNEVYKYINNVRNQVNAKEGDKLQENVITWGTFGISKFANYLTGELPLKNSILKNFSIINDLVDSCVSFSDKCEIVGDKIYNENDNAAKFIEDFPSWNIQLRWSLKLNLITYGHNKRSLYTGKDIISEMNKRGLLKDTFAAQSLQNWEALITSNPYDMFNRSHKRLFMSKSNDFLINYIRNLKKGEVVDLYPPILELCSDSFKNFVEGLQGQDLTEDKIKIFLRNVRENPGWERDQKVDNTEKLLKKTITKLVPNWKKEAKKAWGKGEYFHIRNHKITNLPPTICEIKYVHQWYQWDGPLNPNLRNFQEMFFQEYNNHNKHIGPHVYELPVVDWVNLKFEKSDNENYSIKYYYNLKWYETIGIRQYTDISYGQKLVDKFHNSEKLDNNITPEEYYTKLNKFSLTTINWDNPIQPEVWSTFKIYLPGDFFKYNFASKIYKKDMKDIWDDDNWNTFFTKQKNLESLLRKKVKDLISEQEYKSGQIKKLIYEYEEYLSQTRVATIKGVGVENKDYSIDKIVSPESITLLMKILYEQVTENVETNNVFLEKKDNLKKEIEYLHKSVDELVKTGYQEYTIQYYEFIRELEISISSAYIKKLEGERIIELITKILLKPETGNLITLKSTPELFLKASNYVDMLKRTSKALQIIPTKNKAETLSGGRDTGTLFYRVNERIDSIQNIIKNHEKKSTQVSNPFQKNFPYEKVQEQIDKYESMILIDMQMQLASPSDREDFNKELKNILDDIKTSTQISNGDISEQSINELVNRRIKQLELIQGPTRRENLDSQHYKNFYRQQSILDFLKYRSVGDGPFELNAYISSSISKCKMKSLYETYDKYLAFCHYSENQFVIRESLLQEIDLQKSWRANTWVKSITTILMAIPPIIYHKLRSKDEGIVQRTSSQDQTRPTGVNFGDLMKKIEDLNRELTNCTYEKDKMERESQDKINNLESAYETKKIELDQKSKQIELLNQQNITRSQNILGMRIVEDQDEIKNLKQQYEQLCSEKMEENNKRYVELSQECNEIKKNSYSQRLENESLKNQLNDEKNKSKSLNTRVDWYRTVCGEIDNLTDIEEARGKLIPDKFKSIMEENENLKKQLNAQQILGGVSQGRDNVQNCCNELENLLNSVENNIFEISNIEKRVGNNLDPNHFNEKIALVRDHIINLKQKNESLSLQKKSQDQKSNKQQTSFDKIQKDLKSTNESLLKDRKELEQNIKECQEKINRIKTSLERQDFIQTNSEDVEKNLNKLYILYNELKTNLTNTNKELENLYQQLDQQLDQQLESETNEETISVKIDDMVIQMIEIAKVLRISQKIYIPERIIKLQSTNISKLQELIKNLHSQVLNVNKDLSDLFILKQILVGEYEKLYNASSCEIVDFMKKIIGKIKKEKEFITRFENMYESLSQKKLSNLFAFFKGDLESGKIDRNIRTDNVQVLLDMFENKTAIFGETESLKQFDTASYTVDNTQEKKDLIKLLDSDLFVDFCARSNSFENIDIATIKKCISIVNTGNRNLDSMYFNEKNIEQKIHDKIKEYKGLSEKYNEVQSVIPNIKNLQTKITKAQQNEISKIGFIFKEIISIAGQIE